MTRDISQLDELVANSNHVSKWVEEQPSGSQASYAQTIFSKLLGEAAQPRLASGNACVKLCGFVAQSSKSHSQDLRLWAFSRNVVVDLFNFYVEWNESDNHRSMKLVLDLLPQLIKRNPDEQTSQATKLFILDTLMSIIVGTSTKPLVKSAIKTLDHFLAKDIVSLDEIRSSYVGVRQGAMFDEEIDVWKSFFVELFHWMNLHIVCPTAGRFIVCLYRALRRQVPEKSAEPSIETWHQWLLAALTEEPSLLESIKTYIILPLFKADRGEALKILRRMNDYDAVSGSAGLHLNTSALLQLAVLETGKKVGLVEEPALNQDETASEEAGSITLHEKILENVLAHSSHEVRSLALSLLISSPSTTRPYSSTALNLLRKHLATYFADSDAKFRNDVASKVRDMFRRVRGAIFVLKKSIPRAVARTQKAGQTEDSSASNPILYRANLISLPESQLTHCLEYHTQFLVWYVHFLCDEMTPTASYQRHIASLKAVQFILRMEGDKAKTWETADDQQLFFDLFDHKWVRGLLDLVMDPFDDVRDCSATVLKRIYSDPRYRRFGLMMQRDETNAAGELTELFKRADELSRQTARADHSDGVARTCQLLYRFLPDEQNRLEFLSKLISGLEQKIAVAEKELGQAVLEAPLHGDLASLCYTWQVVSELQFFEKELESVQALQTRLVICAERVWSAVKSILCDDSPEGHLPLELEEVDVDTKDVLSYSFRAVHEASNLMRVLVQSVRQKPQTGRISPSAELYERIGNFSFTQLSALRHRGAFTTVALTFATCCQLVKYLGEETRGDGSSLLEKWYKGTMDAIYGQVSTTRRSAGIPAMMTGILSSDASHPSFEQVMDKLMSIASIEARVSETDGSNLPQVHAYNCLKDIFKSSYLTSLGNKSEKYLTQCLELAANGLKSEVWAIRNCGLILLRSLIDCLFGSHESKHTMESGWDGKANRIAYHRYPTLPNVLLNLLESGHQMMAPTTSSAGAESVFPALDIIRRAGPPDVLRDELQVHVAKYLASPVWHVREIAARTLCSCLLHNKWLHTIKQLAGEAVATKDDKAQNHVHGVLLALKHIIEKLREVMADQLQADVPDLKQFLHEYWPLIQSFKSPEIAATYLEAVNITRALPNSGFDRFSELEASVTGKQESALLKTQMVFHRIYVASQSPDPIQELRRLLLFDGGKLGVNSLVTALETVPKVWDMSKASDAELSAFCDLYMDVCANIGAPELRTVALQNLSDIFEIFTISQKKLDTVPPTSLTKLWNVLNHSHLSPALANAIIRISGSVMGTLQSQGALTDLGLQNWGLMMSDAGLAEKEFDTRLAAAESLSSYFSITQATCTSPSHLPTLLALYDVLNDDDDDIRDVGSSAVRAILNQALAPLEAATRLLDWMSHTFGDSPSFRATVVSRIIGQSSSGNLASWPSPKHQLAKALRFDDSLFVVEEQNLFIDEVRETDRWTSAFEQLQWIGDEEALHALRAWMSTGLDSICELANREDGPLGWASKPQVFAIGSRVLRGVATLTRIDPSDEQRQALAQSSQGLQTCPSHMSGLLVVSHNSQKRA